MIKQLFSTQEKKRIYLETKIGELIVLKAQYMCRLKEIEEDKKTVNTDKITAINIYCHKDIASLHYCKEVYNPQNVLNTEQDHLHIFRENINNSDYKFLKKLTDKLNPHELFVSYDERYKAVVDLFLKLYEQSEEVRENDFLRAIDEIDKRINKLEIKLKLDKKNS